VRHVREGTPAGGEIVKKGAWAGMALLLLLAGCSSVPFQPTVLVPLEAGDPWTVVRRFQERTPQRYQLLNTVVFEYNFRKFSGIGTVQVDSVSGVFHAAGMNPMGVKLFELSGDGRSVTSHHAMEALTQYGDIAAAVGNDIRRIYFDLVPGREALVRKRTNKLVFRQRAGSGFLEFLFGGAAGELIEKNIPMKTASGGAYRTMSIAISRENACPRVWSSKITNSVTS
jgi:hypothetical protein